MKHNLGTHYILDLGGINPSKIDDINIITDIIQQAVKACGAIILNISHHKFEPQGLTVLALLSESHISYHSFPEKGMSASLDIYTCGEVDTKKAVDVLVKELESTVNEITKLDRGSTTISE